MLLCRQGRLGRPLRVAGLVLLFFVVVIALNMGGQYTCGIIYRVNDSHINVDGRNFILDSAVKLLRPPDAPQHPQEVGRRAKVQQTLEEGEIEIEHINKPSHNLPVQHMLQNSSQSETGPVLSLKSPLISQRNTTDHKFPWGNIDRECLKVQYDLSVLSKVSVIITFHNSEILSNIVETIHAILYRTPKVLLEEIILISDNAQKEDLTVVLDQYIAGLPTNIIKILRSQQQLGLIKARLWGIRTARAPVVVCMDSHMELQEMWLQPLLWEIYLNGKTLAAPYLDWMEFDTQAQRWKITHGASSWKTYFDWNFVFGFQDICPKDRIEQVLHPTKPVICPCTIGTVFAINKAWFTEVGEFDDQMEAWGGENLDLPIRVWLNGGRVVNVPCSHAAHYEAPNSRSYRHGWDDMITRNYKRVAEVWLDEYKHYLYYYRPELVNVDAGNLTSRFALKAKAKYKFKWILENVYPELGMHDKDSFAHTGVANADTNKCLMAIGLYNPSLTMCDYSNPGRQGMFWNIEGQLRFPIHIFNTDYDFKTRRFELKTGEYISRYATQNTLWFHWKGGPMIDVRNRQCLQAAGYNLFMVKCNYNLPAQTWNFNTYTKEYEEFVSSPTPTARTPFLIQLHAVIKAAQAKEWLEVERLIINFTETNTIGPSITQDNLRTPVTVNNS